MIRRAQLNPAKLVHHVAIENDAEKSAPTEPRACGTARLLGVGAAQDHDGRYTPSRMLAMCQC